MSSTQKEALVIILDVGPTVLVPDSSDGSTFLEKSLKCLTMILQRKIFAEAKDELALVLSGTKKTNNPLASASPGEYKNISIVRAMGPVNWAFVEMVQTIKDSKVVVGSESADIVDALVVAMDHMNASTTSQGKNAKCKYSGRQIYFMSDFGGQFSTDQIDVIVSGLRYSDIQLNVIGPDLGPSPSFDNVEIKSKRVKTGVEVIQRILEETAGDSFSFSEVVPALSFFKRKAVRPSAWKVPLQIGPDLSIPVCLYIKVKKQPMKSWKKACAHDQSSRIITEASYHKSDDIQVAIDKSDTIEAFRYGKTLVPFSEEDRANMNYTAGEKSFSVLGFTKQSNVQRHQFTGDGVSYIFADPAQDGGKALSALINGLHELAMVGIVRHVYSKRSSPKLGALIPRIKANYECLVFIQLPFAEDVRHFELPSLDANPKNKPTAEQLNVIDELIDAMDLSHPKDLYKPKLMLNPCIQRLYQCLAHRGVNPGQPLPEIDPELLRSLSPDPKMLDACEPIEKKLYKMFPLKKVMSDKDKKTALNFFNNPEATVKKEEGALGEMDDFVGVLDFVKVGVSEVGTVSPVDNFLEMAVRNNRRDFDRACSQMMKVVEQLVMDSFGELQCQENYKKALVCLDVLRRESIATANSTSSRSAPGPQQSFNEFLRRFKVTLLTRGKHVFWEQIRAAGVNGLITSDECAHSEVTKDEAQTFLSVDEQMEVETEPDVPQDEDVDDLLDMM